MGKTRVKVKVSASGMRELEREWAKSFNDGDEEAEIECPLCGARLRVKAGPAVCPGCGGSVNVSAEL